MAKLQANSGDLADYDRPPVVEVVYGVAFAPLAAWKLPHVGLFWQRIITDFPRCEHSAPLGPELDASAGVPIPRIWLVSETDDRLVQMQPGRFLFNWRWRDGVGPYPRYETLSGRFFELFEVFQRFVAEKELGEIEVSEYELTYINHISEQNGWTFPTDMGRVIEQVSWRRPRHRFLPDPSLIAWRARFDFPEGPGFLFAMLSPAKHTKEGRDILALELSARGLPEGTSLDHMKAWFCHAHRWIVRGFEDLTSDEAQKELWGKHAKRRGS